MPKPRQYYDPHPGVAMLRNWIDTLKEKTGRDLDEWTAFIQSKGPKDNKSWREWLKNEHGLGTNSAWWLADHAGGSGELRESDPDVHREQAVKYVDAMFSGSKAPFARSTTGSTRWSARSATTSASVPAKRSWPFIATTSSPR